MSKTLCSGSLAFAAALFVAACADSPPPLPKDSVKIAHAKVFVELQRPPVMFPHEGHMSALDKEGCGVCHHEYDKARGKLVPVEDDGSPCGQCHKLDRAGRAPGLRQAFHGQCTGCHRSLIAAGKKSGPTTCGECHRRQ